MFLANEWPFLGEFVEHGAFAQGQGGAKRHRAQPPDEHQQDQHELTRPAE